MSDLGSQLHSYIEAVAPAIDEEEVLSGVIQVVPRPTRSVTPRRPLWVGPSVVAAVLICVSLAIVLNGDAETGPAVTPFAPVEPCDLIERASDRAGLHISNPPGSDFRHDHGTWGAATCALGWDGSWADRHLMIREVATSSEEASMLLTRTDLLDGVDGLTWEAQRAGVWVLTQDSPGGFQAVAVSAEPYFFIVTDDILDEAMAIADAVLVELGIDQGDQR